MSTSAPSEPQSNNMESLLRENRVFNPPQQFSQKAHIKSLAAYEAMYHFSIDEPEAFWAWALAPSPNSSVKLIPVLPRWVVSPVTLTW